MANPSPYMLPLEILCCIIDHTNDEFTLSSWSGTCWKLHTAVLCRRRSEFRVDPFLLNFPILTLPALGIHLTNFRRPNNRYPRIDPLVRFLKLDFGSILPPDLNVIVYKRPAFEHMVDALGAHLPKWPSLRQLIHSGVLYQEFLEEIVMNVCRLKSLTMRNLRKDCGQPRGHERSREAHIFNILSQPMSIHSLDFTSLGRLRGLRNLRISALLPGEGEGLGAALKHLFDLKVLNLVVAPADHPYFRKAGQAPGWSPFDDLFMAIYPDVLRSGHHAFGGEPAYGFPSSLQVLELVDDTSTKSALTSRFFDTRVQSHPVIYSYRIQMKCFNQPSTASTSAVLRAYLSPKVNRFALFYSGSFQNPGYLSKMEAIAIYNVIRPFHASIEVLGVPAWHFFKSHSSRGGKIINGLLDSLELYGDLLLGGAQVKHRSEKGCYRLSSYIFGQHHCCKYDTANGSWCRRIRHIWLGDVFIEALEVDELRPANGTLDGLVVLIISPRMLQPEQSELMSETPLWYKDISSDMAKSIAAQRFPALRVIVIGECRFWIEIKEDRSRIWPLAEAIQDTKQASDMTKYLTRMDWQFFTPIYPMETERTIAQITFRKMHGVAGKTPAGDG